jgi:hypothetical protein
MRSDFYSLPWAAQQAIRRGEHVASVARRRAWSIQELEAKVAELEKQLEAANETIRGVNVEATTTRGG